MTRVEAHLILEEEENTATYLVRKFIGCNAGNVEEALILWSHLEDCPPDIAKVLRQLEKGRAMSDPIAKIPLPFELSNGNDGRRKNWFKPAKIRKDFERDLIKLGQVRVPFDFPVVVRVTRVLGPNQRLWDSSSCGRGNYKELEDALVACGWFHDDSMSYIKETRFHQDNTRRGDGPSIVIEVFKAEQ